MLSVLVCKKPHSDSLGKARSSRTHHHNATPRELLHVLKNAKRVHRKVSLFFVHDTSMGYMHGMEPRILRDYLRVHYGRRGTGRVQCHAKPDDLGR